jgi:tetratricopeptide (TPR) repeat protein
LGLAQVREENNLELGTDQFAAAVEKYKPALAEFYAELGDAKVKRHEVGEAVALYEETLRRKPDSLVGLLGLATALEQTHQYPKAADTLQRGTQLYPADARFWQGLGNVYADQGRKTEAVAALQKSLELDPDVPEAHLLMGRLFGQPGGDLARAEASTREAIRLWPNFAQARLNLAVFLSQENRSEEAEYHFKYALHLQPNYALAHFNYGLMLKNLGRMDEAAAQLRAAMQGDSDPAMRESAQQALSGLGK